ncbi:P22_AR N-terminal domain-containing protein [Azotobacter beijerinckii]|uniref:P22_AR N-terminal domain-containing protein n=1 Tax=Azotobacter beijerinckii TaxID=170623 RepID=A0A1I3ZMK7_9GAMM|nr:P22_AR N-terminal domain-containing protein [Azotobacter beijerinckii]
MSNSTAQALSAPQLAIVDFHGHALTVITSPSGQRLVAMRPICEAIGISWQSQYNRIQRNQVLKEGVVVMNTPSAGGEQETTCLPLDYLNG